jgi:acetylornithine deacetylase/succinyl-diaminopimelate desuccinylase-like protein
LKSLRNFIQLIAGKLTGLKGKAARILRRPRKSRSPLADHLLADALRLAEIPSPTDREERRAAFVLERLKSLGILPRVDQDGNILARIRPAAPSDKPPLLLFADLGSRRWHPLESLSRLDAEFARGAGLADILGAAALLSVAERLNAAGRERRRDILLLFAARSGDDPAEKLLLPFTENSPERPFAALGIRGFLLGTLITQPRGTCRMEISLSPERPASRGTAGASAVVDTLLSMASRLSGITWDSGGLTRLYIRRIEALTAFGRCPSEAVLDVELESSDGALLEMAVNTVRATVENSGSPGLRIDLRILSGVPVGDPAISGALMAAVQGIMKELRIKIAEEQGADISALLSCRGIPALSLGIALGEEGREQDAIDINSIERGRQLLETVTLRLSGGEP